MKKHFLSLLLFLLLYSFIEANLTITTTTLKLNATKKIAFISDLHVDEISYLRELILIEKLREIKPEIIIVGGDITSKRNEEEHYTTLLCALSRIGRVYVVLGNWDYYSRVASKKEMGRLEKACNVTFLVNSVAFLDNKTCIYGIDWLNPRKLREKPCKFLISVIHTPEYIDYVKDYSDLVLAGHTHGGQAIIPLFLPVSEKYRKYARGYFEEDKLYVSRGVGTAHLLPFRFFCPPEIVVIE